MSVKNIELESRKYQVYPITGRRALMLDRKVLSLVVNALGMSANKSAMTQAILVEFGKMPEDDFDKLVQETLDGVVYVGDEVSKAITLSGDSIWEHFKGRIDDLYKIILMVWEAYELTPFAKLATNAD